MWVEDRKIASIGVHVSRGVTTHGFAVNVDNDLQPFEWIVPCGLDGVQMTSIAVGRPRACPTSTRLPRDHGAALRRRVRRSCRGSIVPGRRSARAATLAPLTRAPPARTRSRANPGGMDVLEVLGPDVRPFRERKPPWLKVPAPGGPRYRELKQMIDAEDLHTVCQEAACPNVGECWERGTATFMILGDTCTRRCGFCNVKTGKPTWNDPLEPARVARSVARMGLRHAVITSVDRDDLPDYGASAFVGVIRQIRRQAPGLQGRGADPRLPRRRDAAGEGDRRAPRRVQPQRRGRAAAVPGGAARLAVPERSCRVLRNAKEMGGDEVVTKSGLMVGLGETYDEMVEAFGVLREHGVRC